MNEEDILLDQRKTYADFIYRLLMRMDLKSLIKMLDYAIDMI
jgi:hypothetical protein